MATPTMPQPGVAVKPAPAGEKKEPKAKKEKTGVARPRLPRPDDNHVITVMKPNAKTGKAGERFNQLKTGMTIKAYFDLMTKEPWNRTPGQVFSDLRWNTDPNRKLIHIGPTVVPVPLQEAKPAA